MKKAVDHTLVASFCSSILTSFSEVFRAPPGGILTQPASACTHVRVVAYMHVYVCVVECMSNTLHLEVFLQNHENVTSNSVHENVI